MAKTTRLIPGLKYKVKGQEMTFHRWDDITPEFYYESDGHVIYFKDRSWSANDIVPIEGPILKNCRKLATV